MNLKVPRKDKKTQFLSPNPLLINLDLFVLVDRKGARTKRISCFFENNICHVWMRWEDFGPLLSRKSCRGERLGAQPCWLWA
jgi:hypothetical protein